MVEVFLMCVSCDALVFGFPGCGVGRVSEFVRIPEVETLDVDEIGGMVRSARSDFPTYSTLSTC